jgi:tetratricopeptide (TPR) repeat protein
MNKLLKYIVLLLMCGIGALCHGQAQLVESGSLDMVNMGYDSEQYKHLKAKDTLSVKEQANDALLLLSVNVDSAEQSLKTVLYKSIYLQYHNGIAMAYTNLGYVQSIRGNYHAAIAYYNKAKPYIITGFHNRTSLAMFYSSYASPYYHLSQYDSVFHYAELAISVIDTLTDFNVFEAVDVASVYNNIALLWTSVGDLNAAHAHLIKFDGGRCHSPKDGFITIYYRFCITEFSGLVFR